MSESPKTILLVDDNPAFLQNLALRMETAGYRVITAQDGVAALAQLEQENVDLILADIAMPQLNGYQLVERIRENPAWVRIPIILLTARSLDSDIRFGKELGVDDYLTKPIIPDDLLAVVRGKLRRASQLKALQHRPSPSIQAHQDQIAFGDLEIDACHHRVLHNGRDVKLSAREFKLLLALAQQPGHVLSPQELVLTTHGLETAPAEASALIRPMVRTIRRKLGYGSGEKGCMENIRGVGYRLIASGA